MGISGRIAATFQDSQMTPLLALVAFLLGVFAMLVTPREEEPQIDVTMADVLVAFPGASAEDVENLVARRPSRCSRACHGVEHVYSVSRPGMAVITVQFDVGLKYLDAVVRLTTPCSRTATGCRPTSACSNRWSSRAASTTCPSFRSPSGPKTRSVLPSNCSRSPAPSRSN